MNNELSSKNKENVAQEIYKKESVCFRPEDLIKDPYVLEFLGLEGNYKYIYKDN